MTSRLITPKLAELFKQYPLYSQDGKKKDAVCLCVFFIGKVRWYVLEGQPEGDDFTLFSIIVGLAGTEYGYASVKEMESISVDVGSNLPKIPILQDFDVDEEAYIWIGSDGHGKNIIYVRILDFLILG